MSQTASTTAPAPASAASAAPGALELREVTGPSALGGGWRRTWELLYLIALHEFRRTYLGTAIGYVWSVARPLLLFGVLLLVFTQAFKLGDVVRNYPALLLFNIVLFSFFQEATNGAVQSVLNHESVVRKTQFPRLVIPLSVVLTSSFNFTLNLLVVFIFIIALGISPTWTWLLFPIVLLLLLIITIATSLILAALFPRFRDVGIIWGVTATALFYATPVLYPLEMPGEPLSDILALNPLTPIFEMARKWVLDPDAPTPVAFSGDILGLVVPVVLYVAICVFSVWIFNREAPKIAEEL
jgi:ABC-2 type transport system permease protein